jgi:hypothetical protein
MSPIHDITMLWTPYLKMEGLPLGINWEDFYAASSLPALFDGNVQAQRMVQTVEGNFSAAWLQLASETDTLQTQGFLAGRAYNNKTVPDCTLMMEENFKSACLTAIHMVILGHQETKKSTIATTSTHRSVSPV